jgi:uncharacterized protein
MRAMWFDAHLHARALRARDLDDLRFFGIAGALVPAGDEVAAPTGAAIRRDWDGLARAVRRLRRGGLAAYGAVGVPPGRIPLRGLEALLAELPDHLGRPEMSALGPVGLAGDGELAERVLARQLDLARELRLPALVRVPWTGGDQVLRRTLAVLREADLVPSRVLVAPADARAARTIRACGFLAGLWLSGDDRAGAALDEAVGIVSALGPEGVVLGSDAGLGGGDPLALARAADRLGKAGLSDAVVRRVCGENAVAWLGVDLKLRTGATRRG